MPELPEIEAVRRRLETRLRGFEIRRVELRSTQLRMPIPSDIATVLRGAELRRSAGKGSTCCST
jgi:formamidopyrimidine-DNA glycosylase